MFANLKGQVIEAQQFVLVDAQGKPRAELGLARNGDTQLTLKDRTGSSRIELTVGSSTGPALHLKNAAGTTMVVIDLKEEHPRLVMHDKTGKPRMVLVVDEKPALEFTNASGALLARMP